MATRGRCDFCGEGATLVWSDRLQAHACNNCWGRAALDGERPAPVRPRYTYEGGATWWQIAGLVLAEVGAGLAVLAGVALTLGVLAAFTVRGCL